MMKFLARPPCGAFLVLLAAAAGAFGDAGMKLVNTNANYVMGGVYTSPYNISVNGGTATLMICDDFLTNVSLGQTWNAKVTSLSDLQAGGTAKFSTANTVRDYATAAVLAGQLMGLGSFGNATAGELSYAIWGTFDPVLLTNNPASGEGHLTTTELQAAQKFLTDAQAVVDAATVGGVIDLSKIPNLTIYTPDPAGASQEFLRVSMPEPSFIATLGIDLLGIVGFVVLLRRKMARTSS